MSRKYTATPSDVSRTGYSDHPGHLLRRALQRCREIHTEVCADLDITTMQAAAIHALSDLGPTTQSALGKAIDMEPPNVHGLVRRLHKKSLISLSESKQDARAMNIKLTAKGRKFAQVLRKRSEIVTTKFLAPLKKKEQKDLREMLVRLMRADS